MKVEEEDAGVGADRPYVLGCLVAPLLVTVQDGDARPGAGQGTYGGKTDPGRATGHDGDLTFEWPT